LPLAISSAVWFSCKRLRWRLFSYQSNPLSSFASEQSRTEPNLADQPQPVSSSHGLLLPTAHEGPKVHFSRARPPALFRLQGLITLLAACALRSRAGFFSHRRRSWDSPFGAFSSRKVPGLLRPGWAHLPFHPRVFPSHEAMGRPRGLRLLGFSPFGSPWQSDRVLVCRSLDAPLGFCAPTQSQTFR
jgi:hypothetical protein